MLIAAAAQDAYGDVGAAQYGIAPGDSVMMVADVVAVPPTKVLERNGEVVRLRSDRGTVSKPGHLVVVTLVEGTGPRARADSLVTIDDLGQLWGTRHVVTSTYGKEPLTFALATGSTITAWDRALVGVRRGSRVLVLTPPRLAFHRSGQPPEVPGSATMAYVIDVLGVS